jgi:hypothetical protein
MAVSIGTSRTISGDTFYKNQDFDISFSVLNFPVTDASLYFGNSTFGVLPYVDSTTSRFRANSNTIATTGLLGTLSVDVVSSNPRIVSALTPQSYFGTGGVCTDPSGFVYFAHTNGNRIFRVDLCGTVTAFAGTGTAGDSDGNRLTTAQFRAPAAVITDGSGTFYVTDSYRVRKIDSNGTVSTIAGSSTQSYLDGLRTAARFFLPGAMTLRPNGDLLVAESDYHTIRNVSLPTGLVTTYAGRPGFAAYADGSLNITAAGSNQFLRAAGASITLYDTSDASSAWRTDASTAFSTVYAMHAKNTDARTRLLYGGTYSATYSAPLAYQTDLSTALVGATGFDTSLDSVRGIGYDPSWNVYVAGGVKTASNRGPYHSEDNGVTWTTNLSDTTNVLGTCRTVRYANGRWMAGGIGASVFSIPLGMFVDASANLLMSTDGSAWTKSEALHPMYDVKQIAYGNATWVAVGQSGGGDGANIAYSTNNGTTWSNLYLATGATGILTSVAYGNGVWVVGGPDFTVGYPLWRSSNLTDWTPVRDGFSSPLYSAVCNVTFSTLTNTFIAFGTGTSNVLVSSDGSAWTYAPDLAIGALATVDISETYVAPTTYGTARMYFPYGLLYDPAGSLYIADQYNNRVRTIAAGSDTLTTFAGTGTEGISNGTLTTAGMARPSSLGRDSNGTLYVGSFERNTIQAIVGSNVSLVAGANFSPGYVNGAASTARFNGPCGLATTGTTVYISEVYNGDVRTLTTYPEVRPGVPRVPASGTIIATSNYPVTINPRLDVCWTSVGGLIPLFKFEPFSSNSFTANRCGGGLYGTNDVLTYGTSSTELAGFLSGTGTANVLFQGLNGPPTAYTFPPPLTLTVNATSNGTVVDSATTSVTISPARIIYTPCNANLVFYRNEPSPAPVFSLVASDVCLMYSATTLPTGLGFTRTGARTVALTGTPTVQTIGSNYTIVATDTSGRTYSTQVSMVVNPERLLLSVSGPLVQSNLTSITPITPITFTSQFAPYGSYRSMRYSWSPPPPAGLEFLDICGRAISGSSYSVEWQTPPTFDSSFTLTLAGTLTESQLRSFALANTSNYSIVLNGTRTFPLPSLSPAIPRTITLSFGEAVLFSKSNVPPLFVGLDVSDYTYTAKTYFPEVVDTSIESIVVTDGFIPDGLDGSFTPIKQQFALSGTPTNAATYPFTLTATNSNGISTSLTVSPTILNDSIAITPLDGTSFNFIQYRNLSNAKTGFYPYPIRYSVSALSGCNVTLTGANLPAGVSLVSNTGTYDLSGRPSTAAGASTATLTAQVSGTGASASTTFAYSVSAETFFFSSASFPLIQNVPMTPVVIDVSTLSENPVFRFSAPNLPAALQITNTGVISGTPEGGTSGTFDVTAFTAYSSGSNPYSYSVTPDKVLLVPSTYRTVTAPGCNVSIPITAYSLSALTVSNFRFQDPFLYGLTVNSTSGLLSGTLAASLPASTEFAVVGSAGIVDGSLGGLMTTANLTTKRAQMLEIQEQSNLRVYSSDDGGLTWTGVQSNTALVAARVGANNIDTYLIPTSSDTVLRSSNGSTYTTSALGQSAYSPLMTGVAYKPASSTWWIGGTLSNGTRTVRVFKTTTDGVTWEGNVAPSVPDLADRSSNATPDPGVYNAYLYGGVDLAYSDGVLLLGGNQIIRSTDEGATWSATTGSLIEVARFSLDQGTVWIAAGSDRYRSDTDNSYTSDAVTFVYSLDQGETWTNSVSGFNMNAYEVLYADGVWLASGLDWDAGTGTFVGQIRYSFDGENWPVLTDIPSVSYPTTLDVLPLGSLGVIGYDQGEWKLVRTPNDGTATLYSHPGDTPIDVGWTATPIGSQFAGLGANSRFSSYVVQTIDPGADSTVITFPDLGLGPTFISPTQSTYVLWQYMPIPPIVFTATATVPDLFYFVSSLPVGLTWNSATRSVSGACMRTGTQTFTVYVSDGFGGLTSFTVTLIVQVPRIIRQQSGAGAYTALVRDYTEVAAAINARDTRVNPTEEAALGSFASPYAPDVVTPSNCPC